MTSDEVQVIRIVIHDLMNADYDHPRNQMIHPVIAGAVMKLVELVPSEDTDEKV